MKNETKSAPKSENFARRADELQEQAKEFRRKAREAKRKEEAEAKRLAREKLQRDAVKLLEFSKTVPLEVGGRSISVYDFIVAKYDAAQAAKRVQRKAESTTNES